MPLLAENRKRSSNRALPRARRGGAVLEMILALPILTSIAFGIADYGYFFYVKNTIQGAAESGARAGVTVGAVNNDVTTAISNMMSAAGFSSSKYTVAVTDINNNSLDLSTVGSGVTFKVVVSCNWGTVGLHALPSFLGGIPNSKTITGVCVMVTE